MDEALGAVTLFVADVTTAGEFYRRVFAASPIFEDTESVAFRFGAVIVNLLRDEAAGPMIEPATVGTGARLQLSIFVDDVDAHAATLAVRGVQLLNGPVDRPWGKRTLAFADPDGHIWEYAQDIATA